MSDEQIRGQIKPLDDETAYYDVGGIPLIEAVTHIEIGPCIYCGRDPGEEGMLDSARIDPDGVMRGTSVCPACIELLPT